MPTPTFESLSTDLFKYHRKKMPCESTGRFAYVIPLAFGRARICTTYLNDIAGVHDFY